MTTPAVIKAPQVFAKTAVKVRSPSLFPLFLSFRFRLFVLPPRAAYSRPGLAPGLEPLGTGGRGRGLPECGATPTSYPCVQGLPRGWSTRREKALLTFFPFLSSTQFLWGLKASVMKEMVIGATLGLIAGLAWKTNHWNQRRKTEEYYSVQASKK
uniref:Cytochrome c oxidase subunit 5C n=1 Tax=Chloropicon roscoffensis TaxID=1461544 RepID=A0A7S3CI45_9CHLO|mmetsp:Transcript_8633/g.26003  ORF Transcript_8633/g.26003 Transcript_8633/m.26003 type:complete len:155 (+) Transcript_8633:63-527(+)